MRDRLTDGAVDVPLAQIMAALELLIEAFQNTTCLLAGAARSVDGDMISTLLRDHPKPAFDKREVLAVLAEQHRGELVVLERKHGLRGGRLFGGGGGRDHGIVVRKGESSSCCGEKRCLGSSASVPNRVLLPTSVIVTR